MTESPVSLVRAALQAYVDKDRATIEQLIADDFRFTSPLDNALDRETYFKVCWPNSANMRSFEIVASAENGNKAFVTYDAIVEGGRRFRNCEVHIVRGGKMTDVEVYFGWNLPHDVLKGEHRDP